MKLAVSNIAWLAEQDENVYRMMEKYGFTGLEIAPTRVLEDTPYEKLLEAEKWAEQLHEQCGFVVPSMQSIWYGRQEKLFGTLEERTSLAEYTEKAINFAVAIGCRNLVFGCPGNRTVPEGMSVEKVECTATAFFRQIGNYAASKGTVIGLEANPSIYGTNYINTTNEALSMIRRVNSAGFCLNLDIGTMVQNGESADILTGQICLISHVHVSEPGLGPVIERKLHLQLKKLLEQEAYQGYISIEMRRGDDLTKLENAMRYVREIFG